jgi:hypothetical protein
MARVLPIAFVIAAIYTPAWSQVPDPCPPAAAPSTSTTTARAPGSDSTEPAERQPVERSAILPDAGGEKQSAASGTTLVVVH